MMIEGQVLLHFDPGIALCGYAVIESPSLRVLDYGAIATKAGAPLCDRLAEVHRDATSILRQWNPDRVSFEKPFFFSNSNAAVVQYAVGVVLLAIAQQTDLEPVEFKPSEIKLAATGRGNADKLTVKAAVLDLFGLAHRSKMPDDAYDALAGAYTLHNHLSK